MTDMERAKEWLASQCHDICSEQSTEYDAAHLADLLAEVRAEERNEVMSAASLVDASMLAEARAEGRRQGLEEARAIAGRRAVTAHIDDPCGRCRRDEADHIAVAISALADKVTP